MPLNVATNVAELDFAKIKTNIINAYRSDPTLKDFNFEGSTLSVLLDIMAYITHYQGVYANMAFSERFLDSAQLRNSLVSIAKEIGYFPAQTKSAIAQVEISIPISSVPNPPAVFWIFNTLSFTGTTTDGANHEFISQGTNELYNDGTYYRGSIQITQGVQTKERFVYNSSGRPEFILPGNIDVSTIKCSVKENSAANDLSGVEWLYSKNAIFNGGADNVFFLEEAANNTIRLFFGDGIVGNMIIDQNEIVVDYVSSSGSISNGAGGFTLSTPINGIASNVYTITTVGQASGGSDIETNESIKLNAPSNYAAQERAVTIEDYKALLINKFPWVESINVWGGEDNIPPQYGQVYLAIKPNYGDVLDLIGEQEILTYLKTVSIVGTGINVIQPKLLNVNATTSATISRSLTTDSVLVVEAAIDQAILNYFASTSGSKINLNVKYSKLLEAIDLSHASISSNLTTLSLTYTIIPDTLHAQDFALNMANELVVGSVQSDPWTDTSGNTHVLRDNGQGLLENEINGIIYPSTNGSDNTINYLTGEILIKSFRPDIAPGSTLNINANPVSNDILSSRDIILRSGTQTTSMIEAK